MQRSTAEPTSLRLLLASLHARKCVLAQKMSRLSLPVQTYRDEFACKTSGSTHRGCRDQHCEQGRRQGSRSTSSAEGRTDR